MPKDVLHRSASALLHLVGGMDVCIFCEVLGADMLYEPSSVHFIRTNPIHSWLQVFQAVAELQYC